MLLRRALLWGAQLCTFKCACLHAYAPSMRLSAYTRLSKTTYVCSCMQGTASSAAAGRGARRRGPRRSHRACHHHGTSRVHQAQQAAATHLHVGVICPWSGLAMHTAYSCHNKHVGGMRMLVGVVGVVLGQRTGTYQAFGIGHLTGLAYEHMCHLSLCRLKSR